MRSQNLPTIGLLVELLYVEAALATHSGMNEDDIGTWELHICIQVNSR